MQVHIKFLDNMKLQASFDDFKVVTDQPVRYKGDGTAPSPYDYFLASSALCAGYFVKLYCNTRGLPTGDIEIFQNNTVDPDNRYHQDFRIEIKLPKDFSQKDRAGILAAMDRCTVKRVIQNSPKFSILEKQISEVDLGGLDMDGQTQILSKDSPLEASIIKMREALSTIGINIEISSWRNPIANVWSVHIRDADSPVCYTNGKGSSKLAALASALGEYMERLGSNYFYNDYFLGEEISEESFVFYPDEKWFVIGESFAEGLLDQHMLELYGQDGELRPRHLVDGNTLGSDRGICALPFVRQSDQETVYIPVSILGNLFVSNGMSAGNSKNEARVQAISEIFERAVKNQVIADELALPDVPKSVLEKFPSILEGIQELESKGYSVLVKDSSLGGRFPVMNITLLNPITGGAFASFGAHPCFEVALERCLTELLQGRSFEGLNDFAPPTFNSLAVSEPNNLVDHFIDSSGVVSWKFFSDSTDYEFCEWNFSGSTEEEFVHLMEIFKSIEKEVYIADYQDLGIPACRVIVPGLSEIYEAQDLIWDNHNQALKYRQRILGVHALSDSELQNLVDDIEDDGIDDFKAVGEVIGMAFDESSAWGRLVFIELKMLICMRLKNFEEACSLAEQLVAFSDHGVQRKKEFRLFHVLLELHLDSELDFTDYQVTIAKLYGKDLATELRKCVIGETSFHGLPLIDKDLEAIPTHRSLIESYKKLHSYRSKVWRGMSQ